MIKLFNDKKRIEKSNKRKEKKPLSSQMIQAIERIRQFRDEKQLTNENIAKKTNIKSSNLSEILNFHRSLTINFLIKLYEKYNLSCDYILFDIKKPPVPSLTLADFVRLKEPDLDYENFVTVPLVSGKIAATIGSGIIIDEYVEDWAVVHQKVIGKKKNLISIMIDKRDGDSMQPIMGPGDIVIIDRDDKKIDQKGIYAIRIEDGCTIKKVQINRNYQLLLKSENKNPPYDEVKIIDIQSEEVTPIIGRVIWCSKSL